MGAILGLGLVLAGIAYVTAPPPEDEAELYDVLHSKRHLRDLERIAGKSGVLANDLDDWLASLWEGKMRAVTVLGGSIAAAGLYALATRKATSTDRE
jgi:hypothetical protein